MNLIVTIWGSVQLFFMAWNGAISANVFFSLNSTDPYLEMKNHNQKLTSRNENFLVFTISLKQTKKFLFFFPDKQTRTKSQE